ncbi:MAG: rRNA maturation RNase YbeY [Pseudomonadota bacterium]
MNPAEHPDGIEVLVEDEAWQKALPGACDLAVRAAEAALAAAGARGGLAILLADDARLAELNLAFRSKPGPTNVLSFPAPQNPEGWLGDAALAYGTCRREAEAQGKRLEHHLQHLVAHGVLHLVGYDHEGDAEAAEMEALEVKILADLGAPDPYAAERGGHGQS